MNINREPENLTVNPKACVAANLGVPCCEPPTMTEPVRLCDGHKFQVAAIAEGIDQPPHRPMAEWVALVGPVLRRECRFLGDRMPTALQLTKAIRRAGLGEITAAHAQAIRAEILDREPISSKEGA